MNGPLHPFVRSGRSLVLVGLMGAGKSSVGKRLAAVLGLPFVDADAEIERAAGLTVSEIFERYGEPTFRDGERRVIARLLEGEPKVVAAGGGAFMDPTTRERIRRHALSVWLRADLDLLVRRTGKRGNRPLLNQGDRRQTLERLIEERYPMYAEADITIDTQDESPDETVARLLAALAALPTPAEAGR